MKRYTKDHEWVELVGDIATVGITDHAQDQLGDIVYVELPDAGRAVAAGEAVAVVESTKSVSDVYTPVSGMIVESNNAPIDDPAALNADPEGNAWLFRVSGVSADALVDMMDAAAYQAFCQI
jgi:glycine cleavage system H protein